MEMTPQQKYSVLLEELGTLLQDKNTTISCQRWQIDQLKEKLAEAEKEREEACNRENARGDGKTYFLLDCDALSTLREVNAKLRECYSNIAINCVTDEDIQTIAAVQRVLSSVLPIEGGAA